MSDSAGRTPSPVCQADVRYPGTGYHLFCTRPDGHRGQHRDDTVRIDWPDDPVSAPARASSPEDQ